MKNLTTAIFSKLAGSALYDDINGQMFKMNVPQGTPFPYVVFSIISDSQADSFKHKFDDVAVQFSLFSASGSTLEIEDMYEDLKTLYDDCALSPTSATVCLMYREETAFNVDEIITPEGTQDVYHYAVAYSITQQRN